MSKRVLRKNLSPPSPSSSPSSPSSPSPPSPSSPPIVELPKRLKRGQDISNQINKLEMLSKSPVKKTNQSAIVIGIRDEIKRYCMENNILDNGNISLLDEMTYKDAQEHSFSFICRNGHEFTIKGRTFYQERSKREKNIGRNLNTPDLLCKGCQNAPEYKTIIITSYKQLVDHGVIGSHSIVEIENKVMNVSTYNDIFHNELDFIYNICGHNGKVSLSLLYNAGRGLEVKMGSKLEDFNIKQCSISTCGDKLKSKQIIKNSLIRFGKDHCSTVNDQFIENEMMEFDKVGSHQYHNRRIEIVKDCGCPYSFSGSYLYTYGGTANCPCDSTIKQNLTSKFNELVGKKVIAIKNETIDKVIDRINSTPQEYVRLLPISYINLECGHSSDATMNFFYRHTKEQLIENQDLLICPQCNPGLMVKKVLRDLDQIFSLLHVDPISKENIEVKEKLKIDGVKNSTIFVKDKRGHTISLLAITLYNGNTPFYSLVKCDECEQQDIIVGMVTEFVQNLKASNENFELVSPSVIQEVNSSNSPRSCVIEYKLTTCPCPQFCTVNGLITGQGDPMNCVVCNPPKISETIFTKHLGFQIEEPNHMNNFGRAPRLVCPKGHPKTDHNNKIWCSVCSAGAIMLEVYCRDAINSFLSNEDPLGEYFEFTSKNYFVDSKSSLYDDCRIRWIQAENEEGFNEVVNKNSKKGTLKVLIVEMDEIYHTTSLPRRTRDDEKNQFYTDGRTGDQSVARLGSKFFDKLAPDQRVNGLRDCIAICISEMVNNNVKNSIFISDSSYTDMKHYQDKENILDLSDNFVWAGIAPYSEWSLKKKGKTDYRLFSYGSIIHKNIKFENKTLGKFFGELSKASVEEPLEMELNFKYSEIKTFQSFKVSYCGETFIATVIRISNIFVLVVSSKYQEVFRLFKSCIEIQNIKPKGYFIKQSPSCNSNKIFDCLKNWVPCFLSKTFSSFSPTLSLNQKLAIICQNLSIAFDVANKIHNQ